jgi:uncharacterized hydrophobic protein (TIGR00271 family)
MEKLTKTQKKDCVNRLFGESCLDFDFFLMLLLSAAIIAIGLLIDSVAVIIGGMLITPILSPILVFAMSIVVGDAKLMKRSLNVVLWSIVSVVLISLVTALLTIDKEITNELLARAHPSLAYFLIAMLSGLAVSYALVAPSTSEVLPGVAISVALMPPLATIGIALAFFNWEMAVGALGLFFLNLVGIIFASIIVFSIMNFHDVKEEIEKKLRAEEKELNKEKKEKEAGDFKKLEATVKEAAKVIESNKK